MRNIHISNFIYSFCDGLRTSADENIDSSIPIIKFQVVKHSQDALLRNSYHLRHLKGMGNAARCSTLIGGHSFYHMTFLLLTNKKQKLFESGAFAVNLI
jgi:hypothetical protein